MLGFAAPQQTQAAEVTVYVNGDADIDWQFPYFIIGGGFVL